jgi:hypothetical protein
MRLKPKLGLANQLAPWHKGVTETAKRKDRAMFTLTSSARATALKFSSEAEATAFVAARKLSQETVTLVDATGEMVWEKRFD